MGKKSESESELMDGEADPFEDDSEMNIEEDGSFPLSSIKNFLIFVCPKYFAQTRGMRRIWMTNWIFRSNCKI